ncbi:MAG: manganese-dependent inorganic pyrophosphatase [Patescibacteria group bacterium]
MKIYLLGHIGPDLDAVCAPIEYAEFLEKAKRYSQAQILPAVCDEINKETKFILQKFDVETPVKISAGDILGEDRIILVDHNEEDQRMKGIDSSQIIEIIDHHKININFTSPLRIDVRPLGSASSVVYENFVKEGIEPSTKIASLILASILSDTQGLKSSTTTGLDASFAQALSKLTGLDIENLTFEIFKAKSDISGLTPKQIVKNDYKIFDFDSRKVFIGQIETVEPQKALAMKDKLLNAMEEVKAIEGVGLLYLAITDILKINTQLLYSTDEEKEIVEHAFEGAGEGNVINIGPRMSRKKDIAPPIEKVLTK